MTNPHLGKRLSGSPLVPWSHADEVLIWAIVALVAAVIAHNITRAWRVHQGREEPAGPPYFKP